MTAMATTFKRPRLANPTKLMSIKMILRPRAGGIIMVIAVIALAGLGAVGAFAYRAVSAGAVLPALPPIMKAENAPNENIKNEGDNRPSDLSQTSVANAGSSEEFVSRFPADNEEPPKTGTIFPNPSAPPASAWIGGRGNGDGTTHLFHCSSGNICAAEGGGSSTRAVFLDAEEDQDGRQPGSDGSGKVDTSAATAKSPAAKPSAAAATSPAGNQLAPDVATTAPEAKQPAAAALPVGRPLSLILMRMTIRRRLRRLAPVCLQVREPLRRPPRAEVMRLR